MSATLGSLALAGTMQATGAVATSTAGNVLFVDFVSKSVIGGYAAATGTTAAAVEGAIAAGCSLGPAGVIIVGATAAVFIAEIIYWWTKTHPELETPDVEIKPNQYRWGNLYIAEMSPAGDGTYKIISGGTEFTPDMEGTIFTINDDLTLKFSSTHLVPHFKGVPLRDVWPFTFIDNGRHSDYDHFGRIDNEHPGYISALTADPKDYHPCGLDFTYLPDGNRWGENYRTIGHYGNGATTSLMQFIGYIQRALIEIAIPPPLTIDGVTQKKDLEYTQPPEFAPGYEAWISTGAATPELPNPNIQEIGDYMNEQVQNPGNEPDKGFGYKPGIVIRPQGAPDPDPGQDPNAKPQNKPVPQPLPDPDPAPELPPVDVPPPSPPPLALSTVGAGAVIMYNPTAATVKKVYEYMLSNDFISNIIKLFSDPADYILDLTICPVKPPVDAAKAISVGNVQIPGATAPVVKSQYVTFDCGSLQLSEAYHSYLDYSPFTTASIYLPYIGEREININDVMGGTLSLRYNIDVLTGSCVAALSVDKTVGGVRINSVLYQWEGQVLTHIPIKTSQWQVSLAGLTQGIISGSMAGGPAGAIAGAMASAGMGMISPRISTSGSLSSSAGLLGGQTPYLIIQRPRKETNKAYSAYSGMATSQVVGLGNTHGYVVVKDIHLDGIPATAQELVELEDLLKGGIQL